MDWRERGVVGVLSGIAAVAGSYAVAGPTPAFVVAPVETVVVRTVPGRVIAFFVTNVGHLGERLASATALLATVVVLGAVAVAAADLARRVVAPGLAVWAAIGGVWAYAWATTGRPWLAVAPAIPAGLVVAVAVYTRPTQPPVSESRRRVTRLAAGVLGFGALSYWLGERSAQDVGFRPSEEEFRTPAVARMWETVREASLTVQDLPQFVSEEGQFYVVDINPTDPRVNADDWSLSITGAVENPVDFDYRQLLAHDARTEAINTLRCVSDSVNGELLDTAIWTGVPVAPLLEAARPHSDCECVMLHAVDDYYEEFPIEALERGLLAFGMNGETLPRSHGFPVRALVPGHWGEIQVKWIDEIEILEREADGYWEERGWHGTGPVSTVAKIWTVTHDDDRVVLGGYAYAGLRGVSAVQVSTDGGETWAEAELSAPLPEEDVLHGNVWRQWRFVWEAPPGGEHVVVARAVEADGTVQPSEEADPFPSGASGYAERTISV